MKCYKALRYRIDNRCISLASAVNSSRGEFHPWILVPSLHFISTPRNPIKFRFEPDLNLYLT